MFNHFSPSVKATRDPINLYFTDKCTLELYKIEHLIFSKAYEKVY